MNVREWALITFTILAQMSVGAFIVLRIVHYIASRKAGMDEANRLSDRALIAIIVTLGLGMLASLFHLGNPLNAPRAVTNLATSWLSREIMSGVVFTVLGFLFTLLQWFKIGPSMLRTVIAWLASLMGIVLVYSMSMVYMLPAQPVWNSFTTPITFFTSTILLGTLALGVAFIANHAYIQKKNPKSSDIQSQLMRNSLRWIALTAIVLLGIEIVMIPIYIGHLVLDGGAALAGAKLLLGPFGMLFILKVILGFTGAGVFGLFLFQNAQQAGKETTLRYLVIGAFVLVLASEVIGRVIFYSTQVGVGRL
ncbi:MAG: dimethyl sulfoxide reductase anchor subunit family protein [Anaerolineales bacterium]